MISESSIENLKENLARIIIESNAYNSETNYVKIDKLWEDPIKLSESAIAIKMLLERIYPTKDYKLLVADKEIGEYGLIPIVCLLSEKMLIPIIIWKENAVPLTGESCFFGNYDRKNDNLLILHDVMVAGGTVKSMLEDIEDENRVKAIFSLVDKNDKEIRESFGDIRYDYAVGIFKLKQMKG